MDAVRLYSAAGTLLYGIVITAALICGYTYLSTYLAYKQDIQSNKNVHRNATTSKGQSASPPVLPHFVPVLGSMPEFSNQTIGVFWEQLRRQANKYGLGATSIVLLGTKTHFIFSQEGVSALFKSRALSRAKVDQSLGTNCLGMSQEDAVKAFPENFDAEGKEKTTTARIHTEHLLAASAVNGLTTKFMEVFNSQLQQHPKLDQGIEVDLYSWLWQIIFRSSTTALCGSKLLEMFPDFSKDYVTWEDNMLGLLFGIPKLFAWSAHTARDRTVHRLAAWLEKGYEHQPAEAEDPDWKPYFGARVMRKRHDYYNQQGLSISGQASFDLIFLAGIISNATPATGWLLLHILNPKQEPKDFRARIMAELTMAQREDGTVDVPALTKLPLLNSAFHEVLRLYVDFVAVRAVGESTALGPHYVKKGEQAFAPTWLTHRNPAYFSNPTTFDPERFLTADRETGRTTYSTSGLDGKYFPFANGAYQCPGRIFAKQEVLGSVAVLLLNYDFEFLGFKGQPKHLTEELRQTGQEAFPTLKRNYAGGQVVGIEGDMRVRIKRKSNGKT